MKNIVLTGAGASIEAQVPGAFKMTERILELFESDDAFDQQTHVLRFVVGGLLLQSGVRNQNPFAGVNVEDVFNAMQLLATRHELEAAPFIGSWHSAVNDLDVIRPDKVRAFIRGFKATPSLWSHANNIDRALARILDSRVSGRSSSDSIGRLIQNMCEAATGKSRTHTLFEQMGVSDDSKERAGDGQIFERTAEAMIGKLVDLVWVQDRARIEYLTPLIRFLADGGTIVTLNYDNALELAAEQAGVPVESGILDWSNHGAFPNKTAGIYLLKLHGSIDWSLTEQSPTPLKPLMHEAIRKVKTEEMKKPGFRPAVIFGQKNKLTSKGPYLDLLRVFRERLFEAQRLTVIGYSFRDEHVNEYIAQWFNADQSRSITIVNGPRFPDTEVAFATELMALKNRVTVVAKHASEGIRDLFAQTSLNLPANEPTSSPNGAPATAVQP